MTSGHARSLRKQTTDPERLLWRTLREFKQAGLHFRRQVPIGNYVADFACHRAKVIVELDGSQHGEDDHLEYDSQRTNFLKSRGYRVLRFWNAEVLADPQTVADFILAESSSRMSPPPLTPPRVGGGG
jgi:very-short-patch-repair endonuclease